MSLTLLGGDFDAATSGLAAFAAIVAIQTTIVLGAGLALARVMRRRGAAVQSAWCRIVLTAAVLTPCLSSLLGLAVVRVRIPAGVTSEPVAIAMDRPVERGAQEELPRGNSLSAVAEADRAPLSRGPDVVERSSSSPAISEGSQADALPDRPRLAWFKILVFGSYSAWLCVSAVLVGRLLASVAAARRLVRDADAAEPQLVERCSKLAQQFGIATPGVRRSDFLSSPCVFGWRRPIILLPAMDVPADDVLIHEVAHVVRRDCLWKFFAECTAAVLWLQPLVWGLKSRMEGCAEEVCDDFVVQSGADRCDYADRLARIAERFVPQEAAMGVGIVTHRSSLARRVCRILDSRQGLQTRAARRTVAGMLCGAAAIVLAVSLFGVDRQPGQAVGADDRAQGKDAEGNGAHAPEQPQRHGVAADARAGDSQLPAKEVRGDVVTIRGTVLDPNGQPAAGAKVSIVHSAFFNQVGKWRTIATATVKPTGQFAVVYRKSQYGKPANEADQWYEITLIVEDAGFALEWKDFQEIDASKPLVFKLVPDFPIRGRVIDLQGQPVKDVAVCVLSMNEWIEGNADSWLAELKKSATRPTKRARLSRIVPPPRDRMAPWAVTDRDGRFEMRGIRRDGVVTLALRGESIAYSRLWVLARNMPTLTPELARFEMFKDRLYGSDFTYAADVGRPISGVVRDAASGAPLPGVRVEISRLTGSRVAFAPWEARVLTDSQGRYRLLGMTRRAGNQLTFTPNSDQPYFRREVSVPQGGELGPIALDVQLHRGLWITGRATDKVTGKPVEARVYYLPFLANPFAKKYPEFNSSVKGGDDTQYWTRPDGTFRAVGLPGRAIVGAWAPIGDRRYRRGVGASEIAGMDKEGRFATYWMPFAAGRLWPDVLKEISPAEGTSEVKCDLVFDPGRTIHVSLVDGSGKPVEGASVGGEHNKPAKFDLIGLAPGDKRPILIYHKELRLGKFLMLEFTDQSPSSMTIALEPCATVTGRIVDRHRRGIKASVSANTVPGGDFWPSMEPIDTRSDGRFEYALPAGCDYSLFAEAPRFRPDEFRRVSVESGKTIDVGDIKVMRPRR